MLTTPLDVAATAATALASESVPAPAEVVISARGLCKAYGSHEAVRGIDLEVRRGEIVALLGPNGAGKTTTVEILEGFRAPSAGEVRVLGADPAAAPSQWRDRIGVVLQTAVPEPDLSVRESLELHAGYHRAPRPVDEVLRMVGLEDRAERRGERLSGGERRRLDVGLALVGDPELLFLDEPTTGFDPSARRATWAMVQSLRDEGATVLLTTHYMEEAERLADRVVVLAEGKVVACGDPRDLAGSGPAAAHITFTGSPDVPLPAGLRGRASVRDGGRVSIATERATEDLAVLVPWALEGAGELEGLEVRRPSLEDVYLSLTSPSRRS